MPEIQFDSSDSHAFFNQSAESPIQEGRAHSRSASPLSSANLRKAGASTARKAAGVAVAIFALPVFGLAIVASLPASLVYIPIGTARRMMGHNQEPGANRDTNLSKALWESTCKMLAWAHDFKAVPLHVARIGQVVAPDNTGRDPSFQESTLYVGVQGFGDFSGSLDGINKSLIQDSLDNNSDNPIRKEDFFQFRRTMLTTDSIESYAQELARNLIDIAKSRDNSAELPMNVVANTHSMGGLIIIQCAHELERMQEEGVEGADAICITRVALNGSPIAGSSQAKLAAPLSECARQMDPDSEFIGSLPDKLDEMVGNHGTKFLVTGSAHDTQVSTKSTTKEGLIKKGFSEHLLESNFTFQPLSKREGHLGFYHTKANQAALRDFLPDK